MRIPRDILRSLPDGFAQLAFEGHLSLDVVEVLSRMAQDPALTNSAKSRPAIDGTGLRTKHSYVFSSCAAFSSPDLPAGPSFEKVLCMALVRYCINATNLLNCSVTIFGVRLELTNTLPKFSSYHCSPIQRDCLLWIWIVCIESWRVMGTLTAHGWLLLIEMRKQFVVVGIWSYADVDRLCSRFFWTKDFAERARSFWEAEPKDMTIEME
jgi:hypothetical protein